MMNDPRKPKVLIEVFTSSERNGWICPGLLLNILEMIGSKNQTCSEVSVQLIHDRRPVEYARNHGLTVARDRGVDWCFFLDNDMAFFKNPLQVLDECGNNKHVISFPAFGMMHGLPHNNLFGAVIRQDGNFLEVPRAGTGGMLIHRVIWEKIPGLWFEPLPVKKEFIGTGHFQDIGEDLMFCDLVRRHGFSIWLAKNHGMQHFHTVELSKIGCALGQQAPEFQTHGSQDRNR